jgi:hypothetical protein
MLVDAQETSFDEGLKFIKSVFLSDCCEVTIIEYAMSCEVQNSEFSIKSSITNPPLF